MSMRILFSILVFLILHNNSNAQWIKGSEERIVVDDFIEAGDTGDHEAFQRAIDYGVATGKRNIYFKDRIYYLRDTVLINVQGFALVGSVMGKATFTGGVPIFDGGTTITTDQVGQNTLIHTTRDLQARDIFFDGGSQSPKFATSAIVFSSSINSPDRPVYFNRCRFEDFNKAIWVVDTDPAINNAVIGGAVIITQCVGKYNNYGIYIDDGCHIQALSITGCIMRNNFRIYGNVYGWASFENNTFEGQNDFLDLTIDGTVNFERNYFENNGGDYITRFIGSSSALSYRTLLEYKNQQNVTIDPTTGEEKFPNILTVGYCVLDCPRKRGNTAGIVLIEKELTNNALHYGTNLGYGGGYAFKTDTHGDTSSNVTVILNPTNYLGVEPLVTDTLYIEGSEFDNGTPTTFNTPFGIKQGVNITQQEVLNTDAFSYNQGDLITVTILARYNNAGIGESTGVAPSIDLREGEFLKAFQAVPELYAFREWILITTTFRARASGTNADIRFGPDGTLTGQDCDIACLTIQKVAPSSTLDGSSEMIIPYIK
jgi:hypothetical protein